MDWILASFAIMTAIFFVISFFVARRAYRGIMDRWLVAMLVFIATLDILNTSVSLIMRYSLKLLGVFIP